MLHEFCNFRCFILFPKASVFSFSFSFYRSEYLWPSFRFVTLLGSWIRCEIWSLAHPSWKAPTLSVLIWSKDREQGTNHPSCCEKTVGGCAELLLKTFSNALHEFFPGWTKKSKTFWKQFSAMVVKKHWPFFNRPFLSKHSVFFSPNGHVKIKNEPFSNRFEKGSIWYAEEIVKSEWWRSLTSDDKRIITDLISIVSSPTSARQQPQLNHPPSAASALFRRFFHLVYITLESIWSVVTRELSARRPDSSCLCAPHHQRDESSGTRSYLPSGQKTWQQLEGNTLTHGGEQTAVKTISEGRIRPSVFLCFEQLIDELFLTPADGREFDGSSSHQYKCFYFISLLDSDTK